MVNAIKGLFISCDVPMAQFIVNLNASMPASERFIVHMLDPTHMFVQPHVADMIRNQKNMINAYRGLFISCDVPMAQFILDLNASMPESERFIVRMLDPTHMYVLPYVEQMIKSKVEEFRKHNSYKPR
ncbi:hypothetical protein BAE44_0020509 [Dichanthelium oligosanthes]|uniref:General transcription and DNA repair factor IIH subunit TFB5 n=1 Tax=Dichanthelium oligosanthes TaxID=888268 RepID=A0A1E5UZY7_9POAL|nr:hypothetical protein BAE44_0020509 [Dichanthelium oligosanthes]